jgi:hypothetical protein
MLSIISSVIFSHDVLNGWIIIELSFNSRRANHKCVLDDDILQIGAFFFTLFLVHGYRASNGQTTAFSNAKRLFGALLERA